MDTRKRLGNGYKYGLTLWVNVYEKNYQVYTDVFSKQ